MTRASDLRIGISGWVYPGWRGSFYPDDLIQKRELEYASRRLNSIEINGSFYSLQTPASYEKWHGQTPDDFVFSVKGGRFITHIRRLREIETPLANFFASGLLRLNEKLGPILWQFPATFKFDSERFESFLKLLPHDTVEAAALARQHEKWMKGRVWTRTDAKRPLRHVVEFRHDSFLTEAFIAMLRRHNVGLVIADTANTFPYTEDVTADFVYLRLHGAEVLYQSGYNDSQLDGWAERIRKWQRGSEPHDAKKTSKKRPSPAKRRDIYVYFDNDYKKRAPFDAMSLAQKLGVNWQSEAPAEPKRRRSSAAAAPATLRKKKRAKV